MDAVNPEVDVAFGREVALAPARVLLRPGLLEAPDGGGREPGRVLAEQRNQRLLEVTGGDAFEVEDRDQHVEALRSTSIGRQNRRGKANALGAFADTIAQPGATHGDGTDAGHDLALGQMPMAYQPLAAISGELVGVAAEQGRDFGFNRMCQQRAGTIAQNLRQRIGKTSWLGQLENVSVGHGVSLLKWRSGGLEHPHDTPPIPPCRHQLSSIAPLAAGHGLFDHLVGAAKQGERDSETKSLSGLEIYEQLDFGGLLDLPRPRGHRERPDLVVTEAPLTLCGAARMTRTSQI